MTLRTRPSTILLALALAGGAMSSATAALAGPAQLCPNSFELSGQRLVYCRTQSIFTVSNETTRVVILIHGNGRNAPGYYGTVTGLAAQEGVAAHTAIIAPQFITEDEVDAYALGSQYSYWESSEWKKGGKSENGDRWSSFRWVDEIMIRLILNNPNLREIVVAGFSAGGQFAQRYGGVSKLASAAEYDVRVSFGVMAPSSYMYPDSARPLAVGLECALSYNDYKYGRRVILNTLGNDYALGDISANYARRKFHFAIGADDDVVPLTPQEADALDIDDSCAANAQGLSRLERMHHYASRMVSWCREQGGSVVSCLLRGSVNEVPNVGHSSSGVFGSPAGRNILFHNSGTIPD